MKFKFLAKTVAFITTVLKIGEIPVNAQEGGTAFTDEQRKKLEAVFGTDDTEKVIKALDKELKDMSQNDQSLKAIKDEIDALLAETNMSQEELETLANEGADDGNDLMAQSLARVKALGAKNKEYEAIINKLINEGEGDTGAIIKEALNNEKVKHSATHVFGSAKAYDAFENRNWNKRLAGLSSSATDFRDAATIEKLNGDLELYYRENPEELKSLQRDKFGLPSYWPTRTKVDDRVADGTIATAEITQARKLPWLPKNKQVIKAEEGQVFPVQIDIEFVGHYLQKIEASWLNKFNKEGSQPYKNSFVKFLVSELDKKARQEDRIATIKAVYVETPEDATEPGRFINRQNGLLYLAQQARDVTKKFRPFDVGMPTTNNILEYVDNLIKRLPDEVRAMQGLVLYINPDWLKAYKRRYEQVHGVYNDYDGYPEHPKDYDNIKFEPLVDMTGSDFMFITFDDNIELLENVPLEKSLYHFEYLKRMIYIWADYKMGVRFIHIGNKVAENDPDEFKVQTLWSNTAPVFPADFYVPVHDNETGEIDVNFKNMYVTKGWATAVTKFNKTTPGSVIKIKGNTGLANNVNVTDNANIQLAGDAAFNLKSGGTLTLFVNADGTVKELRRTTAPETAPIPKKNFNTAAIDADEAEVFYFNGGATTAITNILNGVEGKTIRIHGTDTINVNVTLADVAGVIDVASGATLATANDYIELTKVDGLWIETKRTIAG